MMHLNNFENEYISAVSFTLSVFICFDYLLKIKINY